MLDRKEIWRRQGNEKSTPAIRDRAFLWYNFVGQALAQRAENSMYDIEAHWSWGKSSILSISVVLATTDATDSSLDCTSHALFAIVATANAHDLGTVKVACAAGAVAARLHLSSAVASTFVFLEGSLNRK